MVRARYTRLAMALELVDLVVKVQGCHDQLVDDVMQTLAANDIKVCSWFMWRLGAGRFGVAGHLEH